MASIWDTIPKTISEIESVPPEFQAMYLPDKQAGGYKLHDLRGLQKTLGVLKQTKQEADQRIAALEAKLANFGDLTPDAAAELRAQLTALSADQSDKFEYGRQQRREAELKASDLIRAKETKLSKAEAALRERTLEQAIDRALYASQHQPTKARVAAARDLIAKRLAVEADADDNLKVVVLDPSKPKVHAVTASGELATIDDVIAEIATEYPEFFKANPSHGMGSGGSSDSGVSMPANTDDILTWNFRQKKAYQDAYGAEQYLAALKRARDAQQAEMKKRANGG